MMLKVQRRFRALRLSQLCALFAAVTVLGSCGKESTSPEPPTLRLSSIVIDGGARTLERGTKLTLTATVTDTGGRSVTVPLVWRSSVESVVTIGPDGRLTAVDTGVAAIIATALGVVSTPIGIHVVWLGPAKIATLQFTPPLAASPAGELPDSIRVIVTNPDGNRVQARVRFTVTAGGGTVSPAAPALVDVGPGGWAAAKWHFGAGPGQNTVTATVVGADSLPIPWVADNPVSFTVKTYEALQVIQGDNQTAAILSALPVAPRIRLVDSLGRGRAGVPVTFTATANGRVVNTNLSTEADGAVGPGTWTLGDLPGEQQLIVSVEAAKLVLRATATGTPNRYTASKIATSSAASCAVASDGTSSCMGQAVQNGAGDTLGRSAPIATAGGFKVSSLAGGTSHFCGTTLDQGIVCWGISAYADATGAIINTSTPRRLQGTTAWLEVSPGGQHNCALASDHSPYCWGENGSGQLGDGGTTRHFAPGLVSGGFKFDAVAAGGVHSCGFTSADSTAYCWGLNSSGQLGDGSTTNRLSPTLVVGGIRWKALGAGANWTCGLATDGTAYCWGASTGRNTPGSYTGAPVFSTLSVGAAHACGLTTEGRAYCWGDNSAGQLGDSTTTFRANPTEVVTDLRFSSISAGVQHTCGLTTDGFMACWGRNTVGEIGISLPLLQLTPRYVVVGVNP